MATIDINFVKQNQSVFAFDRFDRVESFDTKKLFDIDNQRFSDGWGNAWYYEDYGKTWGLSREQLYESKYDEFRVKAYNLDEIEYIINGDKTTAEQKMLLIRAYLYGFYGRLYGFTDKSYDAYHIPGYKASMGLYVSKFGNELLEVIGMPGPDCACYRAEDYGKSWALTVEELQ